MTKVEEFAEYMAKAAERFIEAANNYTLAAQDVLDGELHEDDLDSSFIDDYSGALKALQSSIYEFRKRVAK